MNGPGLTPTWWELVSRLAARIHREHNITPELREAVTELRDLLDEWLADMADRR